MKTTLFDNDGYEISQVVGNVDELDFLIGQDINGKVVASIRDSTPSPIEPTTDELINMRRIQRASTFTITIDKMNPIWYSSLTEEQQTNLATWRQQWLEYPTSGEEPNTALIEGIF